MRARVVFSARRVLSTSRAPSPFTVPAKTSAPISLRTGTLSPVIGAWSTVLDPAATWPSRGMRSPGRTTKWVPTATSTAKVSSSRPSSNFTRAIVGARSSSAEMARRARPTLQLSSARDRAKRNATVAASNHSPMVMAPMTAIIISRWMSGRSRRAAYHAFGRTNRPPNIVASP